MTSKFVLFVARRIDFYVQNCMKLIIQCLCPYHTQISYHFSSYTSWTRGGQHYILVHFYYVTATQVCSSPLYIYLSVSTSICTSTYLSTYIHTYLSIYLYQSIYLHPYVWNEMSLMFALMHNKHKWMSRNQPFFLVFNHTNAAKYMHMYLYMCIVSLLLSNVLTLNWKKNHSSL